MTELRKAIIFARVSTKRQEKEGLSLDEIQIPQAKEYATKNGLVVVKVFKIGETGGEYKARTKFNEMVEFMKANKDVTDIISFRVDRITRNFRDAVTMDDLRLSYGKIIHCIDDHLVLTENSSSNDVTQWDMKVMFAKMYLNRVKDDGNNTKYNKLERGELPWCAPYGYEFRKIDAQSKSTVVTVEPKFSIARDIHVRYSSGNFSCKTLAKSINKDYGTKLPPSAIYRILTDKFYIGIMVDKKSGKEYPHRYEQLISQDTFERNQDILAGHGCRRRRYAGVPSPYRALIDCDICGCSITPEPKHKKQKNGNVHDYMYYHCTNGKNAHTGKMAYISEKALDAQVATAFDVFKRLPVEEAERIKTELKSSHEAKNRFQDDLLHGLRMKRDQLQNRTRSSYDKLMDGSITQEVYDDNVKRYDSELTDLKAQINRLDTADKEYYMTCSYLLALMAHGGELFKVANDDEKRQLLGLVVQNLKLNEKRLSFQMREPFATLFGVKNVLYGWAGGIRTPECQDQNLVPYRLATAQ